MADLPTPKNAPDIGECIYCGSRERPLHKEHAIPYGLNGPWTLLAASCAPCANVTLKFEQDCLRGLYASVRTALAMQTRRPNKRPRTLPLVLEFGSERRTVQVEQSEFPLYLPTPIFPPPGAATGAAPRMLEPDDVELQFLHISGPTFEAAALRHAADFAGVRLNFAPPDFARALAKIALCAFVYSVGIEPLRASPIRDVILGKDPNVGHWVGSWAGEPQNELKGLHAMKVRTTGTMVHVILRLFAQFGAPEYHVVLGEADPAFVRSDTWPWK